ncbi:MAG TPA: phosphoribosylamine--glycine ligase, partial [Clostridiales bacterium]|nr:phosphoribosylamine--glycine ligase [Clostridiales bacterium]
EDHAKALQYLEQAAYPLVIKADGLALGKGVVIATDKKEAAGAVKAMMQDRIFGTAGERILFEEFLHGPEVSVLAFTDGKTLVPMASSQDHKRAGDGDTGPNTGGMGAFSPSPLYTPEIAAYCMENIYLPTLRAMEREGRPFKGVLYFGLMLTPNGPRVLEYNARFGDPETQAVLPRLKTDLLQIFDAVIDGRLDQISIEWEDNAAVCIIAASGGYPGVYATGYAMEGLKEASKMKDINLFHAGTQIKDGRYVTAGGRVLGVTATGPDLSEAVKKAYAAIDRIRFKDMYFRKDIGTRK